MSGTNVQAASESLVLNDSEQRPIQYRVIILRLLGYLFRHRAPVSVSIAAMLVYSSTVVAMPWLVKLVIDQHIVAGSDDLVRLSGIVALYVLASVVQFVSGYVHRRIFARLGQEMVYEMRTELFDQLQHLSVSFFDKNKAGRIMSRIQNDVEHIQELVLIFVISLANVVSVAGIAVAMMFMDLPLALMMIALALGLIPALNVWQRLARPHYQRVRQTIAEVNSRFQENIAGVRVIHSLNRQETNASLFDEVNRGNLVASLMALRYSAGIFPSVEVLTGTALVLVVYVGGNMVLGGSLEMGVVVAFALYIERLFGPIQEMANQFEQLQKAMVSADRIFELLDMEPQVSERPGAAKLTAVRGEVRYEGVDFYYTPETPILHQVDLQIRAGETVALIGPTGAGKTTLVSLLLRYYDVVQGRITVDGYDVRDLNKASLARQMSVVLQEPYLFSGTVRDNIRYNRAEATDEAVVRATKAVGAHDFVTELEDGYDTVLQERGGNLSVGQRQLISFARALVADPRILILDEATANIDTHTEMLIQRALSELLRDRTALIIAHRLSTIRNADRIVVMDQGRMVEQGSHDELMTRGGKYAELQTYTLGAPG